MLTPEKLRYALLMSAAVATACSGSESDPEEQFLDGGSMTGADAAIEEQPPADAGPMDASSMDDASGDDDQDAGHDAGLDAGLRVGAITVTTYVRANLGAIPGLAPQTPRPTWTWWS